MGNHNGKDTSGPTGSPLDFFHTPPTTPSEAELTAMALSSSNKAQTPSPEAASGGGGSSSTPSSASPEWAQRACAPSEWAVISVEGDTKVGEQSWQERDSGLEAQAGGEQDGEPDGEEMSLVLLSLMEHYRPSLGLSPNADPTAGAVELLRHLITERDELAEEVRNLRETLRTERLEWRQFQCDLQVAVSVADRLRMESEQALGTLQESHCSVQAQLAEALGSRREAELRLDTLQDDYRDVCARLSQLQQQRAQLDALREVCSTKEATPPTKEATPIKEDEEEEPHKAVEEAESAKPDMEAKTVDPVEANGSKDAQLTGRGVAEGYLRSLAALEKKKDGQGQRDPRRIVMLSERSWSLSRLPLPTEASDHNGSSKITSTTLPLCKKEEPTKGRRKDHLLKRQDSWSSFYTGKQEEEQSSESIKPQDGFSALLRRHGGSRRNSLLRWCQGRTQGYKNIEITNFSSSWEDGLAFCAVYHTYLPTHIPYDSLLPVDKRQNLDLAFKTGESVGITATLTAEEMLKAGGPDWQRVLGYVESMFRHFEM